MTSPVRIARWMAAACLLLLGGQGVAAAAIYTVTTTADSGAGSLRQAILDANANPGADTIVFGIPGQGVQTITVLSFMPITDAVLIDGYSQGGAHPNTDPVASNAIIVIDLQGTDTDGFEVSGGTLDLRGVALHGFDGAVHFLGPGGNSISGCFIGLLPDGLSAPGNAVGLWDQSDTADSIGDGMFANRNVISGNGVGLQLDGGGMTVVKGNLIGTNAAGTAPLGNGTGIAVTSAIQLGGTVTFGQRNVISGNAGDGVHIESGQGFHSDVSGNLVGLDASGTHPMGNGGTGIRVDTDGAPTIQSNYVSANGAHGIDVDNSAGSSVASNVIGLDVNGQGELGNGGAGIHGYSPTGAINGNTIAHNRYGLWIENQLPSDAITWSTNSIFDNGGLGIVLGNPPSISDPQAVITSIVHSVSTTTIDGFIDVPVGMSVPTSIGLEFFTSPACSKKRPADFDEGKTSIGTLTLDAFGSPAAFSADLPVVTTDEIITATARYTACLPFGEGGCASAPASGPFSQRLPYSISPASGSPAGGDAITISGAHFAAGAVATIGGQAVGSPNVVGPAEIDATAPALAAGAAYDVTVANTDGSHGTIPLAWLSDFLDVPQAHPFHDYVRPVVTNGLATGVGGGNFGVAAGTLRQQMAVFLLKAKHGICYTPPPCAGAFSDVPCPSLFADWIEALASEGITGGCGGGNYCPTAAVRRDQMAAFLLKAEHGSTYVPPPCAGTFTDVACPSLFADWIEQLAAEQVTGGCGGGNYCPSNPNTRGQMAVFLTKTFKLQ